MTGEGATYALPMIGAVLASLVFLIANVAVLLFVLAHNRRTRTGSQAHVSSSRPSDRQDAKSEPKSALAAGDILGWEFEYARTTASEAMSERHTMVNFYLLVTGVVSSAVVAIAGQGSVLPAVAGTLLLWLLCGIGWVYFVAIIRLRQAWHESARAMNQIKDFYIEHVQDMDGDTLRGAFRWQTATLPEADRPWTVYFFSALLIALLNSAMYVAGGILLALPALPAYLAFMLGTVGCFGLALFAFHIWLYFAFLKS